MNTRLYDPDGSLSFRSKFLISQALTFAVKMLQGYEDLEGIDIDYALAEPSNRLDMEELLELFPLYGDLIENETIKERNDNEKS